MSRSYRKPWYTQGYGSICRRWKKRYANKAVRNAVDVPNGKAYRKYWDSWNICDWKWVYNPNTKYYWWNGKLTVIKPDPPWTVNRK